MRRNSVNASQALGDMRADLEDVTGSSYNVRPDHKDLQRRMITGIGGLSLPSDI